MFENIDGFRQSNSQELMKLYNQNPLQILFLTIYTKTTHWVKFKWKITYVQNDDEWEINMFVPGGWGEGGRGGDQLHPIAQHRSYASP